MTEARTMGRDLQEDILSAVRKSQAAVIEAIQAWTSKVQSITPDLPDLNLPFTDKLPKPHELIASAYDFAEQMLASQRKFAEDALEGDGAADGSPARGTGQEERIRDQVIPVARRARQVRRAIRFAAAEPWPGRSYSGLHRSAARSSTGANGASVVASVRRHRSCPYGDGGPHGSHCCPPDPVAETRLGSWWCAPVSGCWMSIRSSWLGDATRTRCWPWPTTSRRFLPW